MPFVVSQYWLHWGPILYFPGRPQMEYQYWLNIGVRLEVVAIKRQYGKNIVIEKPTLQKHRKGNGGIFLANIGALLAKCKHPNIGTTFPATIVNI